MRLRTPGIYKIYSISKPDRVYVGSAANVAARKRHHYYLLRHNKHHSVKLQRHYNKYGKDDLVFVIIEPCFTEFLIVREQYYIDILNPYFNTCLIAGRTTGFKLSEKTKKLLSELKGGINHWNYGKKHSEETILKMREAHKGRKGLCGEENGMYGKKRSAETRAKVSETLKRAYAEGRKPWNLGIKHTEEHRAKLRQARKGKKPTLGMKHTDEAKRKMSEKRKGVKPDWEVKVCPHCDLEMAIGNYTRWHGDNCKQAQLN